MIVKKEVENKPKLMNYLNTEEYTQIIKSLNDKIERIGSTSKTLKKINNYLDRERNL